MTDRAELQAAQEAEIIRRLVMEHPGKIIPAIVELAQACPAPLPRWFSAQRWRILALALEQCLAGEIPDDPAAWVDYLATIPQDVALAVASGKSAPKWTPINTPAESAAARLGGFSALCSIPDQGLGLISWTALCKRLANAGRVRFAITAIKETLHQVEESTLDEGPGPALGAGMERLAGVMSGTGIAADLGESLSQAVAQGQADAEIRASGTCASWGLASLDALVPLRPGGLYVLAASPGGGKTSLAMQATEATAGGGVGQSGAVAYVSEEMPATQLAVLLAARTLGIASKAITEGKIAPDGQEMASLRHLADQWAKARAISVLDAGTDGRSTTSRACTWMRLRHQVSGGKLALIVVDHLGLLESDNPKATEYQRISDTTRALKRAAMQLKVPILALCQMNRAGRKAIKGKQGKVEASPEPTLEDLRGSGSIEQDADAVVMLHRPDATAKKDVAITAYVRKNRSGPLGQASLNFHAPFQVFTDSQPPAPEDPLSAQERANRMERMRSAPSRDEEIF